MDALLISKSLLVLLCFGITVAYASVGLGGGIYLVPVILILGLGTKREAAAAGTVFTWINSLSGLAARVQRLSVEWTDKCTIFLPGFASLGHTAVAIGRSTRRSSCPNTTQKSSGQLRPELFVFL